MKASLSALDVPEVGTVVNGGEQSCLSGLAAFILIILISFWFPSFLSPSCNEERVPPPARGKKKKKSGRKKRRR